MRRRKLPEITDRSAARRWNPVQDSVETAEGIFWRLGKKTVMSMQLRRIM